MKFEFEVDEIDNKVTLLNYKSPYDMAERDRYLLHIHAIQKWAEQEYDEDGNFNIVEEE